MTQISSNFVKNSYEAVNYLLSEIKDGVECRGPDIVFNPELYLKLRKNEMSDGAYLFLMDVINDAK